MEDRCARPTCSSTSTASSYPSPTSAARPRPPTRATTSSSPAAAPTTAWCTSWRQDATALIGPLLDLPILPYVDLPCPQITTSHPNGYLWKRDHVDAWLGDASAVWIDDDFTGLDHEWAVKRTAKGTATLLIQPDPHLGLQPEHLTEVRRWISQLLTARAA